MKAKYIFFILLPPVLAASSLLMPGGTGKAIHEGGEIGRLSLPSFKIGVPETSDKPLAFGKDQNEIILAASGDESAETKLSENRRSQSDAATEKTGAPDMLAMLFDSKTEAEPSVASSRNAQNSRKGPGKNMLPGIIIGSGSGLHSERQPQIHSSANSSSGAVPEFGSVPSPGVSGGFSSGPAPSSDSGAGSNSDPSDTENPVSLTDSDPVDGSGDSERPWEILSDPIDDWEPDPLLLGSPWKLPPIIIGKPRDLDPDSPLNPLPPPDNSINPFASPEFTPPADQFPDPNSLPLPPTGGGTSPVHVSAPTPAPVPEPGTVILLGSGLVALIFYKRRFRRS